TQALGARRRDQADALARAALGAGSWMGLCIAVLALAGSTPLLHLLNAPPEVLVPAVPFLMAMGLGLLIDSWTSVCSSVLRAHLQARDALAVIVATHAVHLTLALLLMPRFGLPGYALAFACSRLVALPLNLLQWRWRLQLRVRWADWWRLPRAELAAMLHIGLPGAAENIAYRLAFLVSVAVAGQLGAAALATQAYALQLMYFVLLFGLATGFACEIVVGHLVGAGKLHAAHRLVRRALARGLGVSVVIATLMALAAPHLLGLFTQDPAIIELGSKLMWITVLLEPGRTFNLVVINALRATGDARYPVLAGATSMVIVLAGGAYLLGPLFGLVGIWFAYAADEWIRGLLMWRRWARLQWVPQARAMHRRLHREETS
ncbi:MAG TPA: MATE family efflux transporter, partial [Burkholderiaceae bacterium]